MYFCEAPYWCTIILLGQHRTLPFSKQSAFPLSRAFSLLTTESGAIYICTLSEGEAFERSAYLQAPQGWFRILGLYWLK